MNIIFCVVFVALIANINCYALPGEDDWLAVPAYEILQINDPFDNGFDDDIHPIVHIRNVRQVFGGLTRAENGGTTGTFGGSGNLLNQNGHNLDGHGQISRTWKPTGPTTIGGGLNYQGPRVGATVDANHVRHFGTDLSATANANIWRSPNQRSSLDGNANYNQHFGGPGGRSKPNYGAGVTFKHNF